MTKKLPLDTKNYLVFMIENKIENSPQDSVFKDKKLYEAWYDPISWFSTGEKKSQEDVEKEMKGFGGGSGTGSPAPKKKKETPEYDEIMMGDSGEMTGEEENPFMKLLGAGGAALLGGAAAMGGKAGAGLLKGVGQSLGKFGIGGKLGKGGLNYAAKGLASLGKQAEEISGKTWIEAQLGKIGQSQMELAAQGAGSPWTKFVIPEKKPSKIISPQERRQAEYDAETEALKKEMRARNVRTKAKQQGLIP